MRYAEQLKVALILIFVLNMTITAFADVSDTIDVSATSDSFPPTIIDLTEPTGYSGQNHTFKANITDNEGGSGVNFANLRYWYDTEDNSTLVSMVTNNGITYFANVTLDPQYTKIYYEIIAYDYADNSNSVEGNVTIYDATPPEISDVLIYPYVAQINQTVNVSCRVVDNVEVKNVTFVDTILGIPYDMTPSSDNMYYIHMQYTQPGAYTFYIKANDTSGNVARTKTYTIQVVTQSYAASDIIKIYVPKSGVIQGKQSFIVVKLTTADGVPLSGFADRIQCTIIGPDRQYILQNATPYELRSGIYICNFTAPVNVTGNCVAYAVVNYTDSQKYIDANAFSIVWDYYSNVSRLTERIGDIVWLVHYEAKNITDTVAFHVREQSNRLILYLPSKEEQSLQQKFISMSLNELYKFIFWAVVISIVFSVSAILYGQRKARKIASTIIQVVKAPEQLIENQTKKKK
ncbi:MAG: hypothetical protein DRH06_00490 [Deltaproteobacteria bacterium]|nr:MAG: hypothetical protein DRH06_00490 [Deltaproteobacteria bacterium]